MKSATATINLDLLDPLRTLEKCISKDILPIEAVFHYFNCNGCRQDKVQGWKYRDEIDGQWKFFTIVNRCSDCFNGRQSKEVFSEIQQQRNQRLMDQYWLIDPMLKEAGFKNYQVHNPVQENAKKIVSQFVRSGVKGKFEPENLLIIGSFGSGKSHLATAAARSFKEKGLCTGFLMEEHYISLIHSSYNGGRKKEADILQDLKRFDVLVMDELGSENYKMEESSWVSTRLLHLINARKGKATIYTTNLNTETLPKAIGERAYSRLKVNTKIVDLYSTDYRDNFLQ
ncbi:ATP-binding protein [Fictibacillus norfolkensis]|uniref:ATP-binding protein n=1 Tax=Fictibacillus norfolkensis TaxID=2762233 RepID=A0ABR8SSC5_9BACL|nr:ATP-binding protein [Fictibacillus norfolkensis]MBD7966253.1 ATP-binding protein [Fictibacillus norfolkensis]